MRSFSHKPFSTCSSKTVVHHDNNNYLTATEHKIAVCTVVDYKLSIFFNRLNQKYEVNYILLAVLQFYLMFKLVDTRCTCSAREAKISYKMYFDL